jgi:hypothetical protein
MIGAPASNMYSMWGDRSSPVKVFTTVSNMDRFAISLWGGTNTFGGQINLKTARVRKFCFEGLAAWLLASSFPIACEFDGVQLGEQTMYERGA